MLLCLSILTALLCLTRLTLRLDLHHQGRTQGRILLRWGRWRHMWHLALIRTEHGHQVVLAGTDGTPRPISPVAMKDTPADLLMQTLTRADKARRFLLRHIRLTCLDGLLCLRLQDAARCALLSGAMQGATAFVPLKWREQVHLRIVPDFFRDSSTLQIRCILSVRLGTLVITACMMIFALIREACTKKEA